MKQKRPKTTADYAALFHSSPRTVARWKRDGAPLEDPQKMRQWFAGRKNLPPELKRHLAGEARTRRAKASKALRHDAGEELAGTIGAPAALERLERAEIASFRLLQSALESGDAIEIRNAREGWLKVGDSLRRYDLLVERERRQSGEMVNRTEIERHVSAFVQSLKIAARRASAALAPDLAGLTTPAGVCELLDKVLLDQIINACVAISSQPCKAQVPEWFFMAALRPMDDALSDATGTAKARLKAFREVFGAMCERNTRLAIVSATHSEQIPEETA